MRRGMVVTGLVALLAGPVVLLAGVASARTGRTYVIDIGTEKPRYKPHLLVLGAHPVITHIRWLRWRPSFADGRGTLDYADHYEHFTRPVRVHLYRPKRCKSGVRIFTRQRINAVRARDRKRLKFVTDIRDTGSCAYLG